MIGMQRSLEKSYVAKMLASEISETEKLSRRQRLIEKKKESKEAESFDHWCNQKGFEFVAVSQS